MLAGLVSITAPCAFVSSLTALFIGGVAGILVVKSALFVEHRLRIDDPVGAVSVHGVNGAWGILALGLLADGTYGAGLNGVEGGVRGLLYGDGGQLIASLIGIGANLWYVGVSAAVCFWFVDKLVVHRPALADEIAGLDVPELGMEGYATDTPTLSGSRSSFLPLGPGETHSGSIAPAGAFSSQSISSQITRR
jgi:Amt family ammonium transporter